MGNSGEKRKNKKSKDKSKWETSSQASQGRGWGGSLFSCPVSLAAEEHLARGARDLGMVGELWGTTTP